MQKGDAVRDNNVCATCAKIIDDTLSWRTLARSAGRPLGAEIGGGNVGGIEGIDQTDANLRALPGLTELVEALTKTGRSAEGLAVLDGFAAQSPELGGSTPEFLRLRGELLLLQTAPATAKPSEDLFRQALDLAHQQGALSWELRAATSLARLLSNQGHPSDAIACLEPV